VTAVLEELDPFDLPDWLGTDDVTWEATSGLRSSHVVTGTLSAGGQRLPCDLLAVDQAYPAPVAHDEVRSRAHQVWNHGQVLLVTREDRLTIGIPAREFDAELVLDALSRFAKAVGGTPENYSVRLRIGVTGITPDG
jgi:hypothetical protein